MVSLRSNAIMGVSTVLSRVSISAREASWAEPRRGNAEWHSNTKARAPAESRARSDSSRVQARGARSQTASAPRRRPARSWIGAPRKALRSPAGNPAAAAAAASDTAVGPSNTAWSRWGHFSGQTESPERWAGSPNDPRNRNSLSESRRRAAAGALRAWAVRRITDRNSSGGFPSDKTIPATASRREVSLRPNAVSGCMSSLYLTLQQDFSSIYAIPPVAKWEKGRTIRLPTVHRQRSGLVYILSPVL